MVNQNLFRSLNKNLPQTDTINDAGGIAYSLTDKEALAQFAVTGCFSNTFYSSGELQLQRVLELANKVDADFLAKVTLYSAEKAWLKDMPSALLLILSNKDINLFHKIFDRVIKNGKMLKAFFQMVRSGAFGRKSLSYALQKEIQDWLLEASLNKLLDASIGNDPSLRDVLRCARPTPKNDEQSAVFSFLVDKKEKYNDLPDKVKALVDFRFFNNVDEASELMLETKEKMQLDILSKENFRWDLISGDIVSDKVWKEVAKQMGYKAMIKNINTLMRHNVFDSQEVIDFIAGRISDEKEIMRANIFPYQYLTAYKFCDSDTPFPILNALGKAADISCHNVGKLDGTFIIGLDVSGSMGNSITGIRHNKKGAQIQQSKMRCIDIAALFASIMIKNANDVIVYPFDERIYIVDNKSLMSRDISSLANWLSHFGGGGTNCSLPLLAANRLLKEKKVDGVVLVSDCESWVYNDPKLGNSRYSTEVLKEWEKFRKNQAELGNKDCKLVCIDLVPNTTTQALSREDILNVGGWNDSVFTIIQNFFGGKSNFIEEIEAYGS